MYKLIIVDDEALVREAVREQMDWRELGYICTGDCEDGAEALECIERDPPDVVLTDIYMPFLDGLELTKVLAERYPGIKVVILTGFDDFHYAQQAVKLQAFDFVLKPVTAAELSEVMKRLKEELDQGRRKEQDLERMRRELRESLPLLRERFLERLVTVSIPRSVREEQARYFSLAWTGRWAAELAVEVDAFTLEPSRPSSPEDGELLRFALFNIVQEMAGPRPDAAVFRTREGQVAVLLTGDDAAELQEEARLLAEAVQAAARQYLPLTLSIGIGRPCRLDDEIHTAHRSALSALEYRFAAGLGSVISLSDMERLPRPGLLEAADWERELTAGLKTGSPQELDAFASRLFALFRTYLYPMDACKMLLQRLTLTLLHTAYAWEAPEAGGIGKQERLWSELNGLPSLDAAERWLKDLLRQAAEAAAGVREDFSAGQVAKAKAYILEHLREPELSLPAVCRHVAVSTSYFSALFKQRTGETFLEYVTRERMEKAKELLRRTSLKSYEIAYEVGFADPHYFSGAFKKYTGDTPTEYRKKTAATS